MNESPIVALLLFVFGIVWLLFPFLVMRVLWNISKETDAIHDTHKAALLKLTGIQDHQKRTNELLEWLGTIQQQPVSSP